MARTAHRLLDRRRALLSLGAASAWLVLQGKPSFSAGLRERRLRLFNIHTGESIDTIYASGEGYDEGALRAINHVLRDFRTEETHRIAPALLDLVHDLGVRLEARSPFDVISGYRSPKTNAALAAESSGVAKTSYHMKGMAIDIALAGRDIRDLYGAAKALRRGGVGLYAPSQFIHVDIGPVRSW